MVSIRDYAKMNNVSYEAIRQQVKRYEDELNGHIIKQNRTQFLDDVLQLYFARVKINLNTEQNSCYILVKIGSKNVLTI